MKNTIKNIALIALAIYSAVATYWLYSIYFYEF